MTTSTFMSTFAQLTTPSTHYRLSDGTVFTSVRRHWAKKENYVCTCVYHHREVRHMEHASSDARALRGAPRADGADEPNT